MLRPLYFATLTPGDQIGSFVAVAVVATYSDEAKTTTATTNNTIRYESSTKER